MIIDLKKKTENDLIKDNVNKLIKSSYNDSLELHEMLEDIPDQLNSHITMRNILRDVKRGIELNEAIKLYAFDACPQAKEYVEEYDCDEISCCSCWKNYLQYYAEKASKVK